MKKLLIGISVSLVVAIASLYGISAYFGSKTAQAAPKPPTIAQLLALVNAERAKHGIAPLKEDSRLDVSAQRKANDEATYRYFGHVSPHDGKHGYEYINDVGISCKSDSENLAWSSTPVQGWIASPPHHKAMIDPKYTLTGFGITGFQIVEHFCQQ